MLRYHHIVTVDTTARIPFECDACHFRAVAIVSTKNRGYAVSNSKHDSSASQAAADSAQREAQREAQTGVPQLAELAKCPQCGYRSASALAAAKATGKKIALIGLATLVVGLALGFISFRINIPLAWGVAGVVTLVGVILILLGPATQRLSMMSADKAVKFEIPHA